MKIGTLEQAVSLSCNINPELIRHQFPDGYVELDEYHFRLDVAVNNLVARAIPGWEPPELAVPPGDTIGPFSEFFQWARIEPRNWTLPGELKDPQARPDSTATQTAPGQRPERQAVLGASSESGDDARPDWTFYCALPHASLAHAVILSMNLIPAVLDRLLPAPIRLEYNRRYEIAFAALQVGDLRSALQTRRLSRDTSIRLPKFVQWAVTPPRNWPLPPELRALAEPQTAVSPAPAPVSPQATAAGERAWESSTKASTTSSPGVTVSLPHTTAELESLFEIIRRNWTTYDERSLP